MFAILSYGVLLPSLGFYWDDYPMVWFAHTLGPAGFPGVFSGDRPFLAGIYILTTALLKTVPWQWQVLGIISRWVAALSLWWTLRRLWPNRPEAVAWIAILFTIFPGFKQQSISVVYSNGFFLLAFYILSYGLMIAAIQALAHRSPNRKRNFILLTIAGVISYIICTFSTEYYIGLDMIRPVLIWLVLGGMMTARKLRLRQTLLHWLPYLGAMFVFLIWRVLVFQFPTYSPKLVGEAANSIGKTLFDLAVRVVTDVFTSAWSAWAHIFRFPRIEDFSERSGQAYWLIVLAAALLTTVFLWRWRPEKHMDHRKAHEDRIAWAKTGVIVGLLMLLVAGAPFWVAKLPITLQFPWDRFFLSLMIGSSIFIVALIHLVIRTRLQRAILFALIVSMAVGSNLDTANSFRREWMTQKDLFWQLVWRAPQLEPGTLVVTHEFPLTYYSDNSLTAPLNWIYAPDNHSLDLPYFLAYTKVRLGASIPELKDGLEVSQVYRNAHFTGSTSDALGVFYASPGCLRVMDPSLDRGLSIYPQDVEKILKISHPEQIITNPETPATPPAEIFGAEPAHTWCYYYQKADLARQMGDWEALVAYMDEAGANNYEPAEPAEWLVPIEGYARTGNWERAMQLTEKAYNQAHHLQLHLCSRLEEYSAIYGMDDSAYGAIITTGRKLECSFSHID